MPDFPFFGRGNAKLPDSTLTFSLPSGFTCPGALRCLSMADRGTGRIEDGPHTLFRCYEASAESRYPSVRQQRWRNFELIRHLDYRQMAELLWRGIEATRNHKSTHVRWFTGGDFFSAEIRDAVIRVAAWDTQLIHYAYTKHVPLFIEGERPLPLPRNLRITMSWGGKFDHLLKRGLWPRTARVVLDAAEAEHRGLPVDFTDQLAWQEAPLHFCHLVHGTQPKGSQASAALRQRRRDGGFTGYGQRKRHLAAC